MADPKCRCGESLLECQGWCVRCSGCGEYFRHLPQGELCKVCVENKPSISLDDSFHNYVEGGI